MDAIPLKWIQAAMSYLDKAGASIEIQLRKTLVKNCRQMQRFFC
jgi:hypothetical protein